MRDELLPRQEGHPKMPPRPFPKGLAATVVSTAVVPCVSASASTAGVKSETVTAEEKQ